MKRPLVISGICALLIASIVAACSSDDAAPVSKEFRYQNPAAGEVELVWGVDGWNTLPAEMFTGETRIINGVMHTRMRRSGADFVAGITVPSGSVVDYGFLVVEDSSGAAVSLWEGDYQDASPDGRVVVSSAMAAGQDARAPGPGDAAKGAALYKDNCAVCHGPEAKGIPGLGLDLTASAFVAAKSEGELVDFIIAGRGVDDPLNTTGVAMPPRGGKPTLADGEVRDIAAFVLSISAASSSPPAAPDAGGAAQQEAQVAAGFTIAEYAVIGDKYLTSLAFGPDGKLYVLSYDGQIWTVADDDGDGIGDAPQLFADGYEKPVGIAWRGSELTIASQGKITLLRDDDGDGVVDEERDIVTDLPAGIQPVHANNQLTFGPDGRLYFAVGSTSDAAPETHTYAASILSVNPDGSDLRVEATGVRNSYEVGFNAAGDMFAADNTPDGEPVVSTSPPEEFNHIVPGGDYGFPAYFGQPPLGSDATGPILNLPVRSAPAGLAFYDGDQFPPEYADNAFVALWTPGEVYRVQLAKAADGEYLARGTLFATGLPGVVDIAVGPEGSLYISASANATIYKISAAKP